LEREILSITADLDADTHAPDRWLILDGDVANPFLFVRHGRHALLGTFSR
jgi:hypothetical protein